ncbi:MAG: putative nicotinate phosphoribosyltransferase [Jatrophihabitantaceae bacterium]|nr:putative nicotinate phosphoribosyltransferase [Jatrophihabitantaceae bacterium]
MSDLLGLRTDHYELSMLSASLTRGTAGRECTFEVFCRRLPAGRRYGVMAGLGRVLDAVARFRFDEGDIAFLLEHRVISDGAAHFLAAYGFQGSIAGYAEGELFFPNSPILSVHGTFADAVILETLLLSILNHDCAVAAAAARMVSAAGGRPIIEMGSRRTHEEAAVAAARAAYLAGFASTSNLAAGRIHGVPTAGTAAHAFTLAHDSEAEAFRAQVDALGVGTTLLVDTYDITQGIATAIEVAGPQLGAVRIDSGDLAVHAHRARAQLDALGARDTRIVVSGDLDEYAIAALAAAPVDAYGAGTAVVTGSGAPTAGLVYKLVEVDGRPVEKRSESKASHGGAKRAWRAYRPTGTAEEEIVQLAGDPPPTASDGLELRELQTTVWRDGSAVAGAGDLIAGRARLAAGLITLPWDGLKLSAGDPAIPTRA